MYAYAKAAKKEGKKEETKSSCDLWMLVRYLCVCVASLTSERASYPEGILLHATTFVF